jgi:UDP-N-acetylmuramoyl-L-alanyl-D-glutamate--2,6-diaminopimelate ligase
MWNIKLGMKHKLTLEKYFQEYQIKGISFDSRNVKAGDAFFAIKGEKFDGNDYIQEVLAKGVSLVFTENPLLQMNKVIYVQNIRDALAKSSGILYPQLPQHLLAVTGTNGKTSVASYVEQLIAKLGVSSASIGTMGVSVSNSANIENKSLAILQKYQASGMTTFDPVSFRELLQILVKQNIQHVIFEASSHGLHQKRIGNIKVNVAAFTSFSQDHLEYHKTMQEYLEAKMILFTDNLSEDAEVIINSNILYLDFISNFFHQNNIKFTTVGPDGHIKIISCEQSLLGQDIECEFEGETYKFYTPIIGSFQATNLLIAAKMVYNIGFKFKDIISVISDIKAVHGRLERVTKEHDDFQIFVDYAHTPDALEKSLIELKTIKKEGGSLVVIFGCGGNRDALKRSIMGEVASTNADLVIVTDDNPRNENAAKIRAEVLVGAQGAFEIADREIAINNAVVNLQKNDILLIAGKGHENYQIIGNNKYAFSDVIIASMALKKNKNYLIK